MRWEATKCPGIRPPRRHPKVRLPPSLHWQGETMDPSDERAPLSADRLPASGAWRVGDPVGHRQFLTIAQERPFALDGGATLREISLAYETWGSLEADGSNAVL